VDVPSSLAYDSTSHCLFVAASPDDGVRRVDRFFNVVEEVVSGYQHSCICVANGLPFTSYTSEDEPDQGACVCSVARSDAITKLVSALLHS
jgi:hypothetical protein